MLVKSSTLYGGVLRAVFCFHCGLIVELEDLNEEKTLPLGIGSKSEWAFDMQFV